MKIHPNIIIENSINKPKKAIQKIKKGKLVPGLYIVCLNENHELEIYKSFVFVQKIYREMNFTIVGLFNSSDNSLEYIRKLTELSFRKYNELRLEQCINELDLFDIDFLYSEPEGD